MNEEGIIDQKSDETKNVNQSLQKIVKGTFIVFIGIIVGRIFAFIGRVLLARFFTPSEYGIFSLGFALVTIFSMITLLGLTDGATREIAYHRGKNDYFRVKKIVFSSIQIAIVTSLLLSIVLFFLSNFISIKVFHDQAFTTPLKIFSISIPFLALINILVSIFRGFEGINESVYFQNISKNILFLLFLFPVFFLGLSFINAIYAFTISAIITCFVFVFYTIKKYNQLFKEKEIIFSTIHIKKDLLLFSLPLLGVAILQILITSTDTFMLGVYKNSWSIGIYNTAHVLADLITLPMVAMLLIYTPIIAGLYAKKLISDIQRNYTILTKWIFFSTLPLFFILFLYPEVVLEFLFGANYILGSNALRILSLAFFFVNILGPNGVTLIAMGKTRFLMFASLSAACMNVILNIGFIPPLGVFGASIATAFSIVFYCMIRHIKVHSLLKTNPINKNLLKPSIAFIVIVIVIYLVGENFLNVSIWILPLFFILFYVLFFLVVLLTRSFDSEDIAMLTILEKRVGIKNAKLTNLLKRFL